MQFDFLAFVAFFALSAGSPLFYIFFLPLFAAWSLAEEVLPFYEEVNTDFMERLIHGDNFKANISISEPARLYVCQGPNWEPPCASYIPEFDYSCHKLHPVHAGQAGSLFIDQGIFCRLATYDGKKCRPFKHVAWMEIGHGWKNLSDWEALEEAHDGENKTIGRLMTHFMCTECYNCPPQGEGRVHWHLMKGRKIHYNTSWDWGDWTPGKEWLQWP